MTAETDTKRIIKDLKKRILVASHRAREGHIASAFSILDIVYVLYSNHVKVDPLNPDSSDRDYFILSKGHGCLALYAVLANRGFFSLEDLNTFCGLHSNLGGHPDRLKVPGVEASTGSLGHGLPIAVGMALGLKASGRDTQRVYCLVGDGELNEGSNWEALLQAEQNKLDNLTVVVDHNSSTTRSVEYRAGLMQRIRSFGCITYTVSDGHCHTDLNTAFGRALVPGMPTVVVAHTVKGKGLKTMENNHEWHHKSPSADELEIFIKELE